MLSTNSYRCELFFSMLRRYCHRYDTPTNAIYSIKRIMLKQVLDAALGWDDRVRPSRYSYANIMHPVYEFNLGKRNHLESVAN